MVTKPALGQLTPAMLREEARLNRAQAEQINGITSGATLPVAGPAVSVSQIQSSDHLIHLINEVALMRVAVERIEATLTDDSPAV